MERRDWHRAAEKRGGEVGEEIAMEKYSGCFRAVLDRVVFTVR